MCCRDHGGRGDRQQTRLMWLVEAVGMEKFISLISEYMGGASFAPAVHVSGQHGAGLAYATAGDVYVPTINECVICMYAWSTSGWLECCLSFLDPRLLTD